MIGKYDIRVTAADVPEEAPLIPEVLPPSGGHLKRYQEVSKLLQNRAQDFAKEVAMYAARVGDRQQMWNAQHALLRLHEELYSYLEMISIVEQNWEEEEFQETERKWRQRRNPMV